MQLQGLRLDLKTNAQPTSSRLSLGVVFFAITLLTRIYLTLKNLSDFSIAGYRFNFFMHPCIYCNKYFENETCMHTFRDTLTFLAWSKVGAQLGIGKTIHVFKFNCLLLYGLDVC